MEYLVRGGSNAAHAVSFPILQTKKGTAMARTGMRMVWLKAPEAQDFPAAQSYLALVYPEPVATAYVKRLKKAATSTFKAKDIFRASGLSLLGVSNSHVANDQKKIRAGIRLSPLLLVRDERIGKVIIADGYHRLCAVYSFDEDALIPCRIV